MGPRSPLPRLVAEGDMRYAVNPFPQNEKSTPPNRCRAFDANRVLRVLALSFACVGMLGNVAAAQTLHVIPVQVTEEDSLSEVKFFGTEDYDLDNCKVHVLSLRRELAPYPLEQLGSWSFVLGSSDGWHQLVRSLGGNVGSPAFTVLGNRTTVLEQALFSATARRRAELLEMFSAGGDTLLRLAVSHELGHALCHEPDEHRADAYGRELRTGKHLFCLSLR
jgi:hypothetical protein